MFETKIYYMNENSPDINNISVCADIIKKGGLVVFPTETVYGLGANALDDASCGRIFEAKKRPQEKALLCHLYDIDQAREIAYINETAELLIKSFTPGPLTVIVKKKACIGNIVSAGGDTVGLRFPSNNTARELIRLTGSPIAATSANISSMPSPTDGKNAAENMEGRVEAIIDSGSTGYGIESTIVSLDEKGYKILRYGAVIEAEIKRVLGL